MNFVGVIFSIALSFCITTTTGQIITTLAGGATGHGGYWGDGGPATAAEIGYFGGLVVNSKGDIFISDGGNGRIRKVDQSTGLITTIAGTGVTGYNGDGIPATNAHLNGNGSIAIDKNDNIYFNDGNNYRVRKIDMVSGLISTVAGTGILGFSGDGGPANLAQISGGSISFDHDGNLLIGDGANHRIRRVNAATNFISSIGGTGTGGCVSDSIPITSAELNSPWIANDKKGNIYFSTLDSCSNVNKIDRITGIVRRIAGTTDRIGTPYGGDGILATNCHITPFGIAIDDTGNLYIADYGNSRIELVDTFGIIRTIAGTGVAGFSGDGSLAILAKINFPQNVTLDKCGNVYIADFNNRRVRKITYRECDYTAVQGQNTKPQNTTITPNPTTGLVTVSAGLPIQSVVIYNLLGQLVEQHSGSGKQQQQVDVSTLPPGMYIVRVNDVWTARLVKE